MTLMDQSREAQRVRAQAEAAAWIAVLHSPERNAPLEAGLRRWITADELHTLAWEIATDVWNETAGLPRRAPLQSVGRYRPSNWYRSPPRLRKPLFALAAALALATATLLFPQIWQTGVSTRVGEQRTLILEDGTRVALNTATRLTIQYDSDARTMVLRSGEAYFEVAPERRPFIVRVGQRKIQALGTAFTVRMDDAPTDNALTVTLLEGRVSVAATTTEVRMLTPGERLRLHPHAPPTLDHTSTERATSWMRGRLIFDHTPLREAIAEFNRYSPTRIKIASAAAGAIPVGGIFKINDSKSFASAVAQTYNLRLELHDREWILESPASDPAATEPSPSP